MIYVYGFCDGNPGLAAAEYQQRFPNRRTNSESVYWSLPGLPGVRIAAERGVNVGVNEEGIRMVHRSAECATSPT
jgi:hypothetical protein